MSLGWLGSETILWAQYRWAESQWGRLTILAWELRSGDWQNQINQTIAKKLKGQILGNLLRTQRYLVRTIHLLWTLVYCRPAHFHRIAVILWYCTLWWSMVMVFFQGWLTKPKQKLSAVPLKDHKRKTWVYSYPTVDFSKWWICENQEAKGTLKVLVGVSNLANGLGGKV